MGACDHDNCEHGHWSSHRHCQVPDCPWVEKRGASQGNFVLGKFVCPYHATTMGQRAAIEAFMLAGMA